MKRRPALLGLAGGLLIGGLLTLIVCLANGVVNARCDILALQQQRICVESEVAKLALQWNHESSRRVIITRARDELELVEAGDPGLVVVMHYGDESSERSFWSRAAGAIDGAGAFIRPASAGESGR